jgi:hypothetical protein
MKLPQKFNDRELLLLALRTYLNSREKRYLADQELMDSGAKCAMHFEINSRLLLLEERPTTVTGLQLCQLVERYGRFLYDNRARRPERWASEDLEHIRFIYDLYDRLSGRDGQYLELHGTSHELTRMYNVMSSLGIFFSIRPALCRIEPENCDWVISLSQEDYQRYRYHQTITGHGFD